MSSRTEDPAFTAGWCKFKLHRSTRRLHLDEARRDRSYCALTERALLEFVASRFNGARPGKYDGSKVIEIDPAGAPFYLPQGEKAADEEAPRTTAGYVEVVLFLSSEISERLARTEPGTWWIVGIRAFTSKDASIQWRMCRAGKSRERSGFLVRAA